MKHKESTKIKLSQAMKKRVSFYDELLMRDLTKKGKNTDWGSIRKLKRRSALLSK